MPGLTPDYALELWYRALTTELGLCVAVEPEDLTPITFAMYGARKDAGDPALACLSLTFRNGGKEMWIWRKPEAKLDD